MAATLDLSGLVFDLFSGPILSRSIPDCNRDWSHALFDFGACRRASAGEEERPEARFPARRAGGDRRGSARFHDLHPGVMWGSSNNLTMPRCGGWLIGQATGRERVFRDV